MCIRDRVLVGELVQIAHAAATLVHEALAVTVEEQIRHLEAHLRALAVHHLGVRGGAHLGAGPHGGLQARAVAEADGLMQALRVGGVVAQHLLSLIHIYINDWELAGSCKAKACGTASYLSLIHIYIYNEVSPYAILLSGGQTTTANLFGRLNASPRHATSMERTGLVGNWDCVTSVSYTHLCGSASRNEHSQ